MTSVVLVRLARDQFIDETAVHEQSYFVALLRRRSLIDLDGATDVSYAEFILKDRPNVAARATVTRKRIRKRSPLASPNLPLNLPDVNPNDFYRSVRTCSPSAVPLNGGRRIVCRLRGCGDADIRGDRVTAPQAAAERGSVAGHAHHRGLREPVRSG